MTSVDDTIDAAFFAEYTAGAGMRRSLRRAQRLMDALGVQVGALPVLGVTASKGKGTAAVHAAAALSAAGLRVGLVTSPHLVELRERIRVDGQPISVDAYGRLAAQVADVVATFPSMSADGGYLSPSGAHTIAAMAHFADVVCDVAVVEAGKGGGSDEMSLLAPRVLSLGAVFGEHLGELGNCVAEIAAEKAAAAGERTAEIIALRQGAAASAPVTARAAHLGVPLRWVDPARSPLRNTLDGVLRGGLNTQNALLGVTAALRLLDVLGLPAPATPRLRKVVSSVRILGKLSVFDVNGVPWLVDSAIDGVGVAAARAHCEQTLGRPTRVLVGLPDSKDVPGTADALHGLTIVPVATRADRRWQFTHPAWPCPAVPLEEATAAATDGPVLAVGMMPFMTELAEHLRLEVPPVYQA